VLHTRRIGHAGTLDPMATGLLVVAVERSTKLLGHLALTDKTYLATIRLGASTSTDDREGETLTTVDPASLAAITDSDIQQQIGRLTGTIQQVPSSVSAIKVDGRRAYALARAGEEVVLQSRTVVIAAFEILARRNVVGEELSARFVDLDVRVECSSGTYVRALARDLGARLGVGGHLTALRRTRIGPFTIQDAATLDAPDLPARLVAPTAIARSLFPVFELDGAQSLDLSHGKRITASDSPDGAPVAAVSPDGRLIGLVEVVAGVARPIVNFPSDEVLA